ncbi:MAG: Transcriptional adapter ada2 [Phylliscum demangeonii]|nr:MAG: Transcriptional adapter ada2 [Phylliscum demangeonii]
MGVIRKQSTAHGFEGGVKCVCDVCSVDITATVHIRCAHEACHDYDLCVPCFSNGSSSHVHDPRTHPYHVIEQHSVPIFTEDWGADEELLLLEGAELYGLGSWADIAHHIGGYRTKDEVRDHYIATYIESSHFPLPERASPQDTTLLNTITREDFQANKKRRIEERKEAAKTAQPATPKQKPTASVPACHEVQGYMPGRQEFETEHANDAEDAVQHMQFEPGDGLNPDTAELDPEVGLKLTVMEIYNARLTARADRKKVLLEHHLLDYKKNMAAEKKLTKEEREIVNKTKPFARLMNHEDYDDFVQGLLREHNLRKAIGQLQEWRRMGLSDLSQGEKYEADKLQRAQRLQTANPLDRLASSRASKATPPVEGPSAAALLTAPELPPHLQARPGSSKLAASSPAAAAARAYHDGEAANGHSSGTATPTSQPARSRPGVQPLANVQPLKFESEVPTDWHLLTKEEQQLCASLRFYAKPYLVLKEQMLKEAIKQGGVLKKKAVKEMCKIDPNRAYKVYDFFVASGWISKG